MEELTLDARPRDPGGANRLRREGYVPAVVYGRGGPPRSVAVDERSLLAVLDRAGRHHIVRVGGQPTLVQEVQREPTTGRILHVDFHAVSLQERVHAEVPLRIRGEERLHKGGGAIVQHQLTEVRVSCRPSDLPDFLPVDVGGLKPGDTLTAGDLDLPPGVELLHDAAEVVLTVLAPRLETVGSAPEAAPSEPEVVGRRARAEDAGA
jgi:large subunit ribosomal protein L25